VPKKIRSRVTNNNGYAYFFRGNAYRDSKQDALAIADYTKCLEYKTPFLAEAYTSREQLLTLMSSLGR